MTKLKRIIFCLTLCIPLVLPLTMKTVNAEDGVILYHRTDLNCDISETNFTSLPDDVYVYRVNTGSNTSYGYLIYKFSDDSFNLGDYASPSNTSYANMSTAIYIDSTIWSRVYCQYYESSNLYSDVPYYNGSYRDLMNYMNNPSHAAVKPDITKIGYLNGIKYIVNKQSTLRESSDIISWNNETDSNGNTFDDTWTVDLSVIPADCVAASEEDWYKKSLFDWQLNSQTILTHTIPATNGSIEVKWSEIIDKNSGIKGWLESIFDAKDINYNAHSWVYRVRLNKGSKNGEWETVYPFVAGTPSEVNKAAQTDSYTENTYNTLNSLAITTSDNETTIINSVDYVYNYDYVINNSDNSTVVNKSISGTSVPANITNPSVDQTLSETSKGLLQKLYDFFNDIIGALGLLTGSLFAMGSGFIARTGFLGQCCDLVIKLCSLLMNSLSQHHDAVLSWNSISLMGTAIIPSGSINLDEVVSQYGLEQLHTICKIIADGSIMYFLSFKIYRKSLEILKLK